MTFAMYQSSRVGCLPSARTTHRGPFRQQVQGSRLVARYAINDLDSDVYMVLGVANCFEKNDEGKLVDKRVIEPLSAPALECLAAGARTSFRHVTGVSLGAALSKDRDTLPEEFQDATYCNKFEYRCEAAARTWQRPHAQDNLMDLVPLGSVRSNFNFDLSDKRVLNLENIVTDDDNIKQDISIDVYGRKEKQEEEAAAQQAPTAEDEDKSDDLDALLMA